MTIQIPFLCGPTTSGKTSIAAAVAHQNEWVILSADSRQVYQGLSLCTGADTEEFLKFNPPVRSELIEFLSPQKIFTLYEYQRLCYRRMRHLMQQNITPMIVGGSGLYIEAIARRYALPSTPENVAFREDCNLLSQEEIKLKLEPLAHLCPHTIDYSSKKRMIRALEIANAALKGPVYLTKWRGKNWVPCVVVLDPPLSVLYDNIARRLDARLENGMIEEVEKLLNHNLTIERAEMLGLEVRYVMRYLTGKLTYEELKSALYQEICRFAKRQKTYFRGFPKRGLSARFVESCQADELSEIFNTKVN